MAGKILTYGDVMEISRLLSESGYNKYGLKITTSVSTKEEMERVNEEFFYRTHSKDDGVKPEDCDTVTLNVNGIEFKYIIDNAEDDW